MRLRPHYANIAATLALLVAVGSTGAPGAVAKAVKRLAPNSVTTKSIKNGAVTGAKVKDRSLTAADIARGSIGGAEIKDGSLGGADIADRSIGSQDIGNGQIFDQNLAAGSVNSRALRDGSITSADISNGTIGTDDIGPMTIRGGLRSEVATDAEVGNIAPQTITQGNLSQSVIDYLTQTWVAGPISKGSTVTGYSGIAFVASLTKDNAVVPADPDCVGNECPTVEKRSVSVSFPARVTGMSDVQQGPSATCPGTFAEPASTEGVACFYVRPDHGTNVGTFDKLDQSDFGFLLGYQPAAAGWTSAQISWAYTRPVS